MAMQIRKATRQKSRLRVGLAGPTGSGKTKSALLMAMGIVGRQTEGNFDNPPGKIGFIDTENGSGDLYDKTTDYDIIQIKAPFTIAKYREAITTFEDAGYDVIIIDSISHAWSGDGGLLDKQSRIAKAGGPGMNSYTAWREVTPDHNHFVDHLLGSPAHIICCMRVKMEYVLETNDKGKQVPRKIGLAPVFRDGIEYEFTLMMDIEQGSHSATASKDRTELFDGWSDRISPRVGKMLSDWLAGAAEVIPPPSQQDAIQKWLAKLHAECLQVSSDEEFDAISHRAEVIRAFEKLSGASLEELSNIFNETTLRLRAASEEMAAAGEP